MSKSLDETNLDKRIDEILTLPSKDHAKQSIKQLIEEEVYRALIKELSQMLDAQIVKPEYHNLVVGKIVGYQFKLKELSNE